MHPPSFTSTASSRGIRDYHNNGKRIYPFAAMIQWMEVILEAMIKKLCGRWLRHFSKDQMELSMVDGKISLYNLVIETSELEALCLPMQPRCIFIGKIFIQFSHLKAGLHIQVTDVLALLRASTADSGFFDVRQALQSHLRLFQNVLESQFRAIAAYTSNLQQFLAAPNARSIIETIQASQLMITNLHIRVEDSTVGNVPTPLALGLQIISLSIVNPSAATSSSANGEEEKWGGLPLHITDPMLINKMIVLDGCRVYLDSSGAVFSLMAKEDVIEMMRLFSQSCEEALKPCALEAHVRYFLPQNKVDIKAGGEALELRAFDDLLQLILNWSHIVSSHLQLLQRNTLRIGSSVSKRAVLRWKFAVDCILTEIRKQKGGWRNYLKTWIQASRYQTLRALLRPYLEVVTFVDSFDQKQERFYENLRLNASSASESSSWTELQRLRFESEYSSYMLPYELPEERMSAAKALVKQHTTNNLTGQGLSHLLTLDRTMIQALYALQLEMDATLSVQILTFLRLDVDHRLRQLERVVGPNQREIGTERARRGSSLASDSPMMDSAADADQPPGPTLLIGIAHGEGFKPMIGSSTVAAICRVTLVTSEGSESKADTSSSSSSRIVESRPCRYEGLLQLAHWHQMFMFDLPPVLVAESWVNREAQAADVDKDNKSLIQIECYEKMAFMEFSSGMLRLGPTQLLVDMNEVICHELPLVQGSSGGLLGNSNDDNSQSLSIPRLRIFTLFCPGGASEEDQSEAKLKRHLSTNQRRRSGEVDLAEQLQNASQKILQLGRASPAAAAGPHGAEEGDPASSSMAMIFPSIATKLDITLITLTLGLARYRDSGRSTVQSIVEAASRASQPTSCEGHYHTARRFLLELQIKGLDGVIKMEPASSSLQTSLLLVTEVEASIDGLSLINHQQQQQDESQQMKKGSGSRETVLSIGKINGGVTLSSTFSESMMTLPRLLSASVKIGLGPYRLCIDPLKKVNARPSTQGSHKVLWQPSALVHRKKGDELIQIIHGVLPFVKQEVKEGGATAAAVLDDDEGWKGGKMVMSFLSLITSSSVIELQYVHPDEEEEVKEKEGGRGIVGEGGRINFEALAEDYWGNSSIATDIPMASTPASEICASNNNEMVGTATMSESEMRKTILALQEQVDYWKARAMDREVVDVD